MKYHDKIKIQKEQRKEVAAYKEQDEDVLSYALFPQVATEYFKYRDAQEKLMLQKEMKKHTLYKM